MAELPAPPTPTLTAIYAAYENHQGDGFREHLGASLIGKSCSRALWFGFRRVTSSRFSGRLLPPVRIHHVPTWFECCMCSHDAACHTGEAAAVNCRTFLHSTPVEGGSHCARHDRWLEPQNQLRACARHLFIPDFVPGTVIDAGEEFVAYRMADGSDWLNDARQKENAHA